MATKMGQVTSGQRARWAVSGRAAGATAVVDIAIGSIDDDAEQ